MQRSAEKIEARFTKPPMPAVARVLSALAALAALAARTVPGARAERVAGTVRVVEFLGGGAHAEVLGLENRTGAALLSDAAPVAGLVGATVAVDGELRGTYIDPVSVGVLGLAARADGPVRGEVSVLHVTTPLPDTPPEWEAGAAASAARVADALTAVSGGAAAVRVTSASVPIEPYETCDFSKLMSDVLYSLPTPETVDYDHVAITMPRAFGGVDADGTTTCRVGGGVFLGVAFVGGRYSWTRADVPDLAHVHALVMAHELGHNFGLGHAAAGGNEYGDGQCAMGGLDNTLGGVTFGAPMLLRLGWVGPANETGGAYLLAPLAEGGGVAVHGDYVLSYRGTTGHDALVAARHRERLLVHRRLPNGDSEYLYGGTGRWRHDRTEFAPIARPNGLEVRVHTDPYELDPRLPIAVLAALAGVVAGLQLRGRRLRGRRAARLRAAAPKKSLRIIKPPPAPPV